VTMSNKQPHERPDDMSFVVVQDELRMVAMRFHRRQRRRSSRMVSGSAVTVTTTTTTTTEEE